MIDQEALHLAANELELTTKYSSFNKQLLVDRINDLLQHDFQKLVNLLYRIDVDENKLRGFLSQDTGQDAAVIITDLIIERQVQKIKSREQFPKKGDAINEEDRW